MTDKAPLIFALLTLLALGACDTAPLDPCDPSSPLHEGLTPEQIAECEAGETGGEVIELDCWQQEGVDDYRLCWAPSSTADLFWAVNPGESHVGTCPDQWATLDWVLGAWATTTLELRVCGLPGAPAHAAGGGGRSIAILENFIRGSWHRGLPGAWPTADMATLGGEHHYCELGVACTGYPGQECFCLCEGDDDCSGLGGLEMVCLDEESGVADEDIPVCVYDGELSDTEELDER